MNLQENIHRIKEVMGLLVEEEQNKFPDGDFEISQLVAYSTLELVKRKIIELKDEEL